MATALEHAAAHTTRSRSTGPTTSSSTSATPSRRRTTIAPRSASSSSAIAARRPACATGRAICSQQGKIRFVLTTAIRADLSTKRSDRRARPASTATACATSRSGWTMRATRSRRRSSAARRRCASRRCSHDDDGEIVIAAIHDLRRDDPLARRAQELPRPVHAGLRRRRAALRAGRTSGSSTSTTASATSSSAR